MRVTSIAGMHAVFIPGATEDEIKIRFDSYDLIDTDDVRLYWQGEFVARFKRGQAVLFCLAYAKGVLNHV